MESNCTQSQKMINLVKKIMATIEKDYLGKEERWYKYFDELLAKLQKPHDLKKLTRDMIPIFGGMGTFTDLVLHKSQFVPLIEENNQLYDLRGELFALCEEILEGEL